MLSRPQARSGRSPPKTVPRRRSRLRLRTGQQEGSKRWSPARGGSLSAGASHGHERSTHRGPCEQISGWHRNLLDRRRLADQASRHTLLEASATRDLVISRRRFGERNSGQSASPSGTAEVRRARA